MGIWCVGLLFVRLLYVGLCCVGAPPPPSQAPPHRGSLCLPYACFYGFYSFVEVFDSVSFWSSLINFCLLILTLATFNI